MTMTYHFLKTKVGSQLLYKMLYELYGKFDGTEEFREIERQIVQIEEQKREISLKETDNMFEPLRNLSKAADVNPSKYESLAEEMDDDD